MDSAKYDAILKRIGRLAVHPDMPEISSGEYGDIQNPMLSLEEFFEGNDDGGSIWCNLDGAPEPDEVYEVLKAIRSRPEVDAVYIMVTQHDGPGYWPFSDTVWIVTSASPDEVVEWLPERFRPDEYWEGMSDQFDVEPVPVPRGKKLVGLWYD